MSSTSDSTSDFTITFYSRSDPQEGVPNSKYPKQCKTRYKVAVPDTGGPVTTDISFGKALLPSFAIGSNVGVGKDVQAAATTEGMTVRTTRSGRQCKPVVRYEPQETVTDDQDTSSRYDEDEDEEDDQ